MPEARRQAWRRRDLELVNIVATLERTSVVAAVKTGQLRYFNILTSHNELFT